MSSIVKLTTEAKELIAKLVENGGELTPELEQMMEGNAVELANKADRYYYLMKSLKGEAAYWKAQMDEVNKVIKGINNFEKNLKERIKYAMIESEMPKIEGNDVQFKISPIQPKLVINDPEKIPDAFKTVVQYTEIDKDKLKEALEAGEEIEGAELVENFQIRSSIKRSK